MKEVRLINCNNLALLVNQFTSPLASVPLCQFQGGHTVMLNMEAILKSFSKIKSADLIKTVGKVLFRL